MAACIERKRCAELGDLNPCRFRSRLRTVLSRNGKLQDAFQESWGDRFRKVQDYYAVHAGEVRIEDVWPWLPELAGNLVEEPEVDEIG